MSELVDDWQATQQLLHRDVRKAAELFLGA